MAQVKKSENVPKVMQEKYKAIVEITDRFSKENLNEDYAQLIRYAVAALDVIFSWYFLFDKSTQAPHIFRTQDI